MIERCYQGDDPEFIQQHYDRMKQHECEDLKEALSIDKPNLVINRNPDKSNHEISDAKDAVYFMDV